MKTRCGLKAFIVLHSQEYNSAGLLLYLHDFAHLLGLRSSQALRGEGSARTPTTMFSAIM